MATFNQSPTGQVTASVTVNDASIATGANGYTYIEVFEYYSRAQDTVSITLLGGSGNFSVPVTGQIWPLGIV
jgi:hypothetical protein